MCEPGTDSYREKLQQGVELLNRAKLSSDAGDKVVCLKGLLELALHQQPSLMPTFLPEILELQVDSAPIIRKVLLEALDGALHVDPSVQTMLHILRCLLNLLTDPVPSVAKRAILSTYPAYRAALTLVAVRASEAHCLPEMRQLWQAAQALQQGVVRLAGTDEENVGTRLAAIKVVEQMILLQTADALPAVTGLLQKARFLGGDNQVISKAELVGGAEHLLGQMIALLHASWGKGPVAITLIKAAASILQQRPQFIGRIIPPLLYLVNSGEMKRHASSANAHADVATALQAALSAVLESKHPTAVAWSTKVADALSTLGGPSARVTSMLAGKRRHLDELLQFDRQPGKLQRTQKSDTGELGSLQHPGLMYTDVELPKTSGAAVIAASAGPFVQVLAALRAAISAKHIPTLAGLILGLQPAAMSELVLEHLGQLPQYGLVQPETAVSDEWIAQFVVEIQQRQRATAARAAESRDDAPRDQQEQGDVVREAPQHVVKLCGRHAIKAVLPVTCILTTLTDEQSSVAERSALLRILRTQNSMARMTRARLVARLAATSLNWAGVVDSIVCHLIEDFHAQHGLEVAIPWLYAALAAQHCPAEYDRGGGASASRQLMTQPGIVDSGSYYEHVMLRLLYGLHQKLGAKDRTLTTILMNAPALPMPGVPCFLWEMCSAGPESATLALLAARDLIIQRPCSRIGILQVVLNAAVAAEQGLRLKAIRLIANQLFAKPFLSRIIEDFALAQLDSLVQAQQKTAHPGQPGMRPAEEAYDDGLIEGADLRQGCTSPSEEEASRACMLYCALCTRQGAMLQHLFQVYAATSAGGQAAIHHQAAGLATTLGTTSPSLLAVVQDPPPGSFPLVLQMVSVLTKSTAPPQALVAACIQLHRTCKDARALVPVLPGMQRTVVLRLLPELLDLPADTLREAFQRLVVVPSGPGLSPLFAASELLASLHSVESQGDPVAALRKAMAGISACINDRSLCPPETLAATINQLLTRVPLPQLFMRTVIQCLAAAPSLRPFILDVLKQLAGRQIWRDPTQWRGWVMCAQQTAPDSFLLLLQLPAHVLAQAMRMLPAQVRSELLSYAASSLNSVSIPDATRDVLYAPDDSFGSL